MSKLIHCADYTVRSVEVQDKISDLMWTRITAVIRWTYDRLKLPPHLLISVVAGHGFDAGPNPGEFASAIYYEGIQIVGICCGEAPHDWTEESWLEWLEETTIHELLHYWQDVNGQLAETAAIEEAAESQCKQLHQEYRALKISAANSSAERTEL